MRRYIALVTVLFLGLLGRSAFAQFTVDNFAVNLNIDGNASAPGDGHLPYSQTDGSTDSTTAYFGLIFDEQNASVLLENEDQLPAAHANSQAGQNVVIDYNLDDGLPDIEASSVLALASAFTDPQVTGAIANASASADFTVTFTTTIPLAYLYDATTDAEQLPASSASLVFEELGPNPMVFLNGSGMTGILEPGTYRVVALASATDTTPASEEPSPNDASYEFKLTLTAVPEPVGLSVLGAGAVMLLSRRRRPLA